MKTKEIFLLMSTWMILLFTACSGDAQNSKLSTMSKYEAKIEVIQFHSQHRCVTCLKIEELTRETLKSYSDVPFILINVDDPKNEKKAELFEASGTALFLNNPKNGKKKDLTDFAFMNAGNQVKFINELKKEISQFGN